MEEEKPKSINITESEYEDLESQVPKGLFLCAICLENHEKNDQVYCPRCTKGMCVWCFAKWRKSCPFCNEQFVYNTEHPEDVHEPLLMNENIQSDCFSRFLYLLVKAILYIILIFLIFMVIGTSLFNFITFEPPKTHHIPSISASPSFSKH